MNARFFVSWLVSWTLVACSPGVEEGPEITDEVQAPGDSTPSETTVLDTDAESSDPASTDTSTGTTMCADGPLSDPIMGCTPAVLPSTGDFGQDCVDRINQLRWECQCLPPLDRWTDAEACSDQQSEEDEVDGVAHGNFGVCDEYAQNTCPGWGSEGQVVDGCMQLMWDEGPGEPFSEHGHYINMSSSSYTKVACGYAPTTGWSNQNFR